ncbi:hypothetical protein [Lunatimonas salinarum]|uniref:hypothetical protein n=1 Tax=Lunatimonas salinarum TaxID=1774590 RepID=UPI001AE0714B|nr:hypothetical protein [Lunatimonas salinarum]
MHIQSILCFFMLASCSPLSREKIAEAPNIILFLVDGMGWQDTSVPFWKEKTEWSELHHGQTEQADY